MDLAKIETETVALSADAARERFAVAVQLVAAAKERLKDIADTLDAKLTEYVREHGPLTLGTVRYYLGTEKKTKVHDVRQAVESLLAVAGGDFDKFCACLSANALKHGMCRSVLDEVGRPELFDAMFAITAEEELKEGKPVAVKKLQKVDERFVP